MSASPRYAIYFVPPVDSPLYRFGSSMLGYDCYACYDVPFLAGLPGDWSALTQAPRCYGFHATLKAPFHLTSDRDEPGIKDAVGAFGRLVRGIPVIQLVVRSLGAFIALVPRDDDPALDRLATDCVTYFDDFRAPLSAADTARRLTPGLSERERSNVARWGYPYVFDDFRFHMTLTGPVPDERRGEIGHLLSSLFRAQCGGGAVAIDRIVLMHQSNENSPFCAIQVAELARRACA